MMQEVLQHYSEHWAKHSKLANYQACEGYEQIRCKHYHELEKLIRLWCDYVDYAGYDYGFTSHMQRFELLCHEHRWTTFSRLSADVRTILRKLERVKVRARGDYPAENRSRM